MSEEIRELIDVDVKEEEQKPEEPTRQVIAEPEKKQTFEESINKHLIAIFNKCLEEGIFDSDTEEAKLILKSVDDPNQKKVLTMSRDPMDIISQIPTLALKNSGLNNMNKERRSKFFDSIDKYSDQLEYQKELISNLGYVLAQIVTNGDNKMFSRFMAGITKRDGLRSIFFDVLCESYEYLDEIKMEFERKKEEQQTDSL